MIKYSSLKLCSYLVIIAENNPLNDYPDEISQEEEEEEIEASDYESEECERSDASKESSDEDCRHGHSKDDDADPLYDEDFDDDYGVGDHDADGLHENEDWRWSYR